MVEVHDLDHKMDPAKTPLHETTRPVVVAAAAGDGVETTVVIDMTEIVIVQEVHR